MEEIQLWRLQQDDTEQLSPVAFPSIEVFDSEQALEDLLAKNPDLLLPGLNIVGRQTSVAGGWLDLLGVDEDGRLVVFELKRGTLSRDAVAQIKDYTSYLDTLEVDDLSHHIAERSGTHGTEQIEDFGRWYELRFLDIQSAQHCRLAWSWSVLESTNLLTEW